MQEFEQALLNYLTREQLKKIEKVKIGIAGAGGLGSNCAFNLVRCGFKKIKIVDFDRVEASNLNRQFFFFDQIGMSKVDALESNLLRFNPELLLETFECKVTNENIEDIFNDCDIVIEAFDLVEFKMLVAETFASSNKLLVSASGLAGWGNSDEIKVRKINSSFYIIGDMTSGVSENKPPLSPRVNIVAAKQADVVLEYVLETL